LAAIVKEVLLVNTLNKNTFKQTWKKISRNMALYVFVLPMLIYFILFHIVPLFGLQIAFRNFKPADGIMGSQWVGLKYITKFLTSYSFWPLMKNTLVISLYTLIIGFPFSIILALIVNYIPFRGMKKLTQTVTYAPHFVSAVVLVGMLNVFLMPSSGVLNAFLINLGFNAVDFLGKPELFPHIYALSDVWSHCGWNAILYIATLANVSPELHEAANIDGANKLKRIWHIDLPALLPTIVIMLIMNCGNLLNVGFEKVLLMQSSANLSSSEIISTYVYKIGLQNGQYSYAAAIGFFNNIINCLILLIVNRLAKKTTETSLW
jgi:putative aldouronate transport system permease protein